MTEEELKLAYRFVCAVESIAAAMQGTATDPAPKRSPGRPRKLPVGEVTEGVAPTVEVVTPEPVKTQPTEDERKAGFALLKTSLQNCLALHGEEETRTRLKHPKFSEVPFDDIAATIERLDA